MPAVVRTMDTRGGRSRVMSAAVHHGGSLLVGGGGTTYAVAGTAAADAGDGVTPDGVGSMVVEVRQRQQRPDTDVGWNPRASMAFDSAKGLLNPVGENNCFLNSAVQVCRYVSAVRLHA